MKLLTLLCQCEAMCKYKDPYVAMLQIRKHAAWYIKGLPGAAAFRGQCGQISSMDDLKQLVYNVLQAEQEQ
jgi:tRNA-dihydrouridine synthase